MEAADIVGAVEEVRDTQECVVVEAVDSSRVCRDELVGREVEADILVEAGPEAEADTFVAQKVVVTEAHP